MTDTPKLPLILRIRLYPQTSRQDELTNCGAEAGEEGVEWLSYPNRVSPDTPFRTLFPSYSNPFPLLYPHKEFLHTNPRSFVHSLKKQQQQQQHQNPSHSHNSQPAHNTQTATRPPQPKTP